MAKSLVTKKRKWNEEYTRFGFTVTISSDEEGRNAIFAALYS